MFLKSSIEKILSVSVTMSTKGTNSVSSLEPHPVKIITTAEGGIITTNNFELYRKAKILGSHGIVKEKDQLINKKESAWYYEQQNLGFNYRMNDIQAALGISQLNKISKFIIKRRKIASIYEEKFKYNKLIQIQKVRKPYESSFHLFIIKLNNKIEKNHELKKYQWQKPHQPNLTGTDSAYYPNKNKNASEKKYKSWKN